MKLTKKQNPFDVKVGQVWKAKDRRRKGNFTVISIDNALHVCFALVVYAKGKTEYRRLINLKRFDRYVKVK